MERQYHKAILLVLASDNDPIYRFFKRVYESYMNENSNIRVFFVYGAGTRFERKDYDLVYDDLKETVTPPWTTRKVIRAMEWIDNNYDYEYLVRTNLSTFWDFESLLRRLENLPKTRCLSGRLGFLKPNFVTGTGMIVSRDLIKEIIAKQDLVNVSYPKYVPEDRMLSEFFTDVAGAEIIKSLNIKLFEHESELNEDDIREAILIARSNGIDHFRIKNIHDRMKFDTRTAQVLLKEYYGKSINIQG